MRFCALFLCLVIVQLQPSVGVADQKKVLIIGIDGCRADALEVAQTPNLDELIRGGAFSAKAQAGPITVSGPSWSSMLTGVWEAKHGVRGNGFEGANYREFPHFFTRLKEARPNVFTASIVHWAPIATKIVAHADVNQTHKTDARVAVAACKLLSERDPDVLFVHLDEVDGAGHRHGFHPKQKEYIAAIEAADGRVGDIVKAVRNRKSYPSEDWLILVSTDHGGSGKSHGRDTPEHRTIFFLAHGPAVQVGAIEPPPLIVDVAVTALMHLQAPVNPNWKLDGKAMGLKAR